MSFRALFISFSIHIQNNEVPKENLKGLLNKQGETTGCLMSPCESSDLFINHGSRALSLEIKLALLKW